MTCHGSALCWTFSVALAWFRLFLQVLPWLGLSVPGSSKLVSTLENTLNWIQRGQSRFLCICFFLVYRSSNAHCHNFCLNHVCCCLLLLPSSSWSKVSGWLPDFIHWRPNFLAWKSWRPENAGLLKTLSGCIKDPSPFHSLPSLKFDNRLLFWQFQLFNYWDSPSAEGSNFWGSKSYGLLSHAKSWGSSCSLCSPCSNTHVVWSFAVILQ